MNKINIKRILSHSFSVMMARTNEAKTSFLCEVISQYKQRYAGDVYVFGIADEIVHKIGAVPFYSMLELEKISNSIIIADEIGKLFDLEDRKKRRLVESTLRLIEHRGNKILASGLPPDFKKFLCGKATCFLYKSLEFADMINGCKAKDILLHYETSEMGAYGLHLQKSEVLCYDGAFWKESFKYNPDYDTKKNNTNLFCERKCAESVPKKVQ